MRQVIFVLFAAVLLSGCIPRYATHRPALDVDIQNEQGEPIPHATFWLQTHRMPPGYYPPPEKFTADNSGHVSVSRVSKWENMIFFLHGTMIYSWSWCVEAPGYLPREGNVESLRPQVKLLKARTPERCRLAQYAEARQ
ncbi:membrane lipoprotein lipid attachment site-containing protein [Cronobacter sakazakii]|uniref:lipoprotein n=1 Tax=Cronobacter sakazakii TaxID=28141 RepID=UPI000CF130D6|nr:lipoprotein [Cronobacter sakazakii]EIX1502190.1 membrane lipoprotein lipid attachment site-containing protein [Cronobacter sakazakii]EIX1525208.1 membrane lipoprotein lipid attachment site-containing protein [Cronobacter sakazakii]EIX1533038.1 membrane lipoprotein lipid attachment site-containing protein [Cronobacter sakazakii]EIX1621041.1 membrane lipoprotein lipid attachment site-containing protein [Cronobacter sakazakii]EIX1662263.1 membrane lipoprotein lipid attachment site-containing p